MKYLSILLVMLTNLACQQEAPTVKQADEVVPAIQLPMQNQVLKKDTIKQAMIPSTSQVAQLIPEGFNLVKNDEGEELVLADFNQDNLIDVALLVEIRGDTTYDWAEEVCLLIALQQKDGTLEKVMVSGNLGGESVSYTDQKHLWAKKGVLSYLHQSMRHHLELKFRYEPISGHFMLIGKEYQDYGSMSSPPYAESTNYLTGKQIIRAQEWNEDTEELEALPEEIRNIEKMEIPAHMIDFESMYDY